MVGGQLAHQSLEPDLAVPAQILTLRPEHRQFLSHGLSCA